MSLRPATGSDPLRRAVDAVTGRPRRAWERALAERDAQRLAAEEAARRAESARRTFFASVTHDVRTPLNGVLGMLDLLLDSDLDAGQRRAAELARASAYAVLTRFSDMLTVSRLSAGAFALEPSRVDLRAVAQGAIDAVRAEALAKVLALTCRVQAGAPGFARVDGGALHQVLAALLANAVKFTERGEVVLSVGATPAGEGAAAVRFAVRDTGVGIAPDRLGAIFDGPVPADGSPSRPYGGGGLNLGICRHLVSLMGGELSASSEPGRGSTFSLVVTLPVEAAPAGPAQPATPRRILLAEDHPVNQQVAGAMLRRRGHHVDIVGNGRLAVDAVRRDVYDVVLMDVQMPELDGLGATRQIRALGGAFETLRIVALTAHEAVDQRAQCEAAGMNAFVTKPFRPADLFEVVETHPPADAARGPAADPAEEPGAPAVDLEGFRATMREAGVEDLVEATLRTYLAETPARLAAMEAAVAAADGRGVQEAAHAVKSSAASIGAGGLAALMRRAEAAGRAGDIDACRTLWPRIAAAAAAVERQISPVAAGAEQ